ncbi:MAG: hypothetical protein F2681_11955 [Actinobacteria bacterium]|uniref:Unannotated protein n=1 Tax=freshwater metagenome TaxID=449393 RepID=A0A6J7LUK1_9ZZZZ|nr:hypothetical protein [Actinomycetota bacterium]MSW78556.1 hypothetical protein [Actinomycetota bacterium]MSX55863.1 hypothetical protein [Actinomycetota bacterium]MSX93184.1 hypothetical protein [Actinomycetota bacterium]MSZ83841.1 hypothetical protein [Actinomycetota bacterium]
MSDSSPDTQQTPIGQVPGLERLTAKGACMSCGGPHARMWGTRDGAARLCPTCATLHGLGCP